MKAVMITEQIKIFIIVLTFLAAYYTRWANETIRRSGLEGVYVTR